MDCFVPLMEHFKQTYGFYPKYPVADAGYGSYNNYIFCEQNGIEKYMKFPMFKKETKDQKYHEDPFRAVNFRIVRRGIHSVKLEVLLVAIGHNLYKYQKKKMRNRTAA